MDLKSKKISFGCRTEFYVLSLFILLLLLLFFSFIFMYAYIYDIIKQMFIYIGAFKLKLKGTKNRESKRKKNTFFSFFECNCMKTFLHSFLFFSICRVPSECGRSWLSILHTFKYISRFLAEFKVVSVI